MGPVNNITAQVFQLRDFRIVQSSADAVEKVSRDNFDVL
jgi:hypothetical protein